MDWGKRNYFYSSFSLASTQMTSLTAKNMHWIRISLIPWICSKNTQHITQPAVHPFDLIRSKIFVNCLKVFVSRVSVLLHWSVQKFSSAVFPYVWLHLCKNFLYPCIRWDDPFRKAWLSVSHPCACCVFACRAYISKECFRMRGHLFIITIIMSQYETLECCPHYE